MSIKEFVKETSAHIAQVQKYLDEMRYHLLQRGRMHDKSKFSEEEAPHFIEYTPKLKTCTYGSDEYKGFLKGLKPALDHHYQMNDHHPEHFENGIQDMNLLQIMELLADWYAASKRHADGDIRKSIEINQARFGYSDEFKQLLLNTLTALDWN